MHTDSEMTGISRSGSMHYMTAASLEMSDEPKYKDSIKQPYFSIFINIVVVLDYYLFFVSL